MNGFPYLANVIREVQLVELKTRRIAEADAAERANNRDYNISPESKAALARGDRQREMGVYNPCTSSYTGIVFTHDCGLENGHEGSHKCADEYCTWNWGI